MVIRNALFRASTLIVVTIGILTGASSAENVENHWAILIGVDDYIEAKDLEYCVADQTALKDRLVASGFPEQQVFLIHDKASDRKYQPTKRNIERQLELVLGLVKRNDVVVLSFSGHGLHYGGKSYLAPNDGELLNPDSLIDVSKVYDLLRQCRASLKLMLVDACRNDPRLGGQRSMRATNTSTALARSFQEATPEGIVLMNSCAPGEVSWEESDWGHGVFMHFILEGLSGSADTNGDGLVSIRELQNHSDLSTRVHVARKYSASQRPFIKNESTFEAFDFGFRVGPAPLAQTLTNSIGMTLKLIPAGEFMMGSKLSPEEIERRFKDSGAKAEYYTDEHPQHRVRITRPFYLGAHEVTFGQFRQFASDTGYRTEAETDGEGGYGWNESKSSFEGRDPKYNWRDVGWSQSDTHPVVNVSWNDAQSFCRWLATKEGVEYRLPTEAEWEYACRAGSTSLYQHGDDPEGLSRVGNTADGTARAKFSAWTGITSRDGHVFTAPAASFRANGFGLHDMHGNVWEWCSDWYGEDYYGSSPASDPEGPSSGSNRVFRGGSWDNFPLLCRSASRFRDSPDGRSSALGFRVLRSSVK